jgi:hypothetical protein
LANKVIWGLEDIMAASLQVQRMMKDAMDRADEQMDAKMLLLLTRMDREMTFIQRKAQDAREGKYQDE